MDKVIIVVLLIALAIGASIAVAVAVQKQWTNQATIYSFDTVGSQISIGEGNATVTILLHNTGTTTAYVSWVSICQPCSKVANSRVSVFFANNGAYMLVAPGNGYANATTLSPSSARVFVGAAWVIIPPKESIYISFEDPTIANLMSAGDRYTAVIYPLSGAAQTFSLTVESK